MMTPLLAPMPVALIALINVALALLSPAAHARFICRWVDDTGRTHMADSVPHRYKPSAICSDSQKYELSSRQKREAEQRAIEAQRKSRQETPDSPAQAASSPPSVRGSASLPNAKRPTEAITETTDCQTRWRIYDESVECFGPYRTTRGATKPEGFDQCNVIPSPEIQCGPPRN